MQEFTHKSERELTIADFNKEHHLPKVTPKNLDILLADGWRHFGTYFFRHTLNFHEEQLVIVFPFRINLKKFSYTKSQRKLIRNNKDIKVVYRPANITDEKMEMFELHKQRFVDNIPNSIYDFVSTTPATIPCETLECCLYLKDKLIAVSFFDVGFNSTSAVYAMFLPEYEKYRPGIFTLLAEIEYGMNNNKLFHYSGHAYREKSHYDYKKGFRGTEFYNWKGQWIDIEHL